MFEGSLLKSFWLWCKQPNDFCGDVRIEIQRSGEVYYGVIYH